MTVINIQPCSNKRPRIAYQNLFNDPDAVVTTSGEDAEFPFENAYNWKETDYWLADADGEAWIQAVFEEPRDVNYFAYYSTTLSENGGAIYLEYSTDEGANWDEAAASAPGGTAPFYSSFETISASYWRVRVDSTPASLIGVVSFGMDFPLQRGLWVGFAPPMLARDTEITNNISESGAFLGRTIKRRGSLSRIDIDWSTQAWVRETWYPFMLHAEQLPWFLYWNKISYPLETAFCMSEGDIEKPTIKKTQYMNGGIKFRCKVD